MAERWVMIATGNRYVVGPFDTREEAMAYAHSDRENWGLVRPLREAKTHSDKTPIGWTLDRATGQTTKLYAEKPD